MIANPFLGVLFHWTGGLASASFYVPYRGVRSWSWEVYWLTGGIFSWIVAPWLFAWFRTEDILIVLSETPMRTLALCYFFGAMWGAGGLTFGLTMRYLGISLGMAVALGLCAAFGTLIPPIVTGDFLSALVPSRHGQIILLGVAICLAGIAVVGLAGYRKEQESDAETRQQTIAEFDFRKGFLVAVFSGVMSSCFAYGLAAGDPIRTLTLSRGTEPLWQGLPVLVVVLLGGFTTNFIWSLALIVKNRSAGEFIGRIAGAATPPAPLLRNYFFCALAGVTWYLQFFFYTMGETQMGPYGFSSWTLHMASIIIFASFWGLILHEWKGAGLRAKVYLWSGIGVLVLSTVVIGIGNALGIAGE